MEESGFWFAAADCPECNVGRLAFAVRLDGSTHYLLCLECGANYVEPPGPGGENLAFDTPPEELAHMPQWASWANIEARGWGGAVAGHRHDPK